MNALEVIFSSKQTANNLFGENNRGNSSASLLSFQNVLNSKKENAKPEVSQSPSTTAENRILDSAFDEHGSIKEGKTSADLIDFNQQSKEVEGSISQNENQQMLLNGFQSIEQINPVVSTKDFGIEADSVRIWDIPASMKAGTTLILSEEQSGERPKDSYVKDTSAELTRLLGQLEIQSNMQGSEMDVNLIASQLLQSIDLSGSSIEERHGSVLKQLLSSETLSERLKELLENSGHDVRYSNQNLENTSEFTNNFINALKPLQNSNEDLAAAQSIRQTQLAKVYSKAQNLLTQLQSEKDFPKIAAKLLELLQQWTSLEQNGNKSSNSSTTQLIMSNEGSKEQLIWKDLVEVFQKRQDIAAKNIYNTDSKVTIQDVTKWLGNALEKHSHSERILNQTIEFMPTTSMQKLEQYTIHINRSQANDTTSTSQQVMDQFQSVMKSSKFLTMPNGSSQLSIALNPNNLGEMRLRLTQIDGEMTVKILVTSQATKDILESNISQLKHMFSPNQVVIEKQEQIMQQNSEQMKEPKDQQMNQQEEDNSNHQEQQEQHYADNEFETQFRELLNEKV